MIPKDYLHAIRLRVDCPFGKKLKLIDKISFGGFGKDAQKCIRICL